MAANSPRFDAACAIGDFACGFDPRRLSPQQMAQVRTAFLDTLAVAVAGGREPASHIAERYAAGMGGVPEATVWSSGLRTCAEVAALANGIAAHVLDYDDVTSIVRGHVSVALIPALLALAPSVNATGRDLAAAYVVGFEVMCRLARAMVGPHYLKGWHSTSTLGTVAATAACGRLLRLDPRQVANALGLAVSQAAGTRASFGSMAKSFQAGHCGSAAIRATRLAQLGFTGAGDALDGDLGFTQLYGQGGDLTEALATLGAETLQLTLCGLEVKKYPMCYATHRALDGVLELRHEHRLALDDVAHVHVTMSQGGLAPLIHHRPKCGLDAKFSIEYAVAAALHDGRVGLRTFEDAAVSRQAIRDFLPQVSSSEAAGSLLPRWVELRLTLREGRVLERRVERLRGAADDPLSPQELADKVVDCFAYRHEAADPRPLLSAMERFPDPSAAEVVAALVGTASDGGAAPAAAQR